MNCCTHEPPSYNAPTVSRGVYLCGITVLVRTVNRVRNGCFRSALRPSGIGLVG